MQCIYQFFTIDAGHPARYSTWSLTYRLRIDRITLSIPVREGQRREASDHAFYCPATVSMLFEKARFLRARSMVSVPCRAGFLKTSTVVPLVVGR